MNPGTSRQELKDLTIWQWRFFVRDHKQPNQGKKSQERFDLTLNEAIHWAGWRTELIKTTSGNSSSLRGVNRRVASVPWCAVDDVRRTVEAREMLDVCYIQTGCEKVGPTHFADLQPWLTATADLTPRDDGEPLLTGAACVTAEIGSVNHGVDPDSLTREILHAWVAEPSDLIDVIETECGFLGLPIHFVGSFAFLVHKGDTAKSQAAQLVHRLMPPLLLAHSKTRAIVNRLDERLIPHIEQIERLIRAELDQLATQSRRLRTLEKMNENLATQQLRFAESVGEIEELVDTLRINRDNISLLLQDPLFVDRNALDNIILGPLNLSIDQFTVDLRYFALTQSQVDRALRGIETMVGLRSVRWERTLAILFGLFALLEVFNAFPELHSLPWYLRLLLVIGAFMLTTLVAMWGVFRRE